MSVSKTVVVLGVTVMALLGAITYLNTDGGLNNLRRSDHDLRVALFKEWMQKFNRIYGVGESELRFKLWSKTYDFVQKHNSMGDTWIAEVNNFADRTDEEFSALYLGFKYDPNRPRTNVVILDEVEEDVEGPKPSVDWRKKDAVTPIKDQKTCGSCYTYSSTGALEALYKIKKGELISMSEQQLLDCTSTSPYGNQGCNGGFMVPCFQYTMSKGIQREANYPYENKKGSCRYKSSDVVYKNANYAEVEKNDHNQLKAAVNKQTVSIAVQADQNAWKNYKSGIITGSCTTKLDHAVLAVGYGTENKTDYWIVKNSWGPSWGESGYIRIARGNQNNGEGLCGVNMECSYPTL